MSNKFHLLFICAGIFLLFKCNGNNNLGYVEALRTYVEFTDGTHRGMYISETGIGGYPDEDFDAVNTMVVNWHKIPEEKDELNARLAYRKIYPEKSEWEVVQGETFDFWHRNEAINRVILYNLQPESIYEYKVKEQGRIYRFRTLPESLDDRSVKIVMTADLQSPEWNDFAHANARLAAAQKPDMFLVAGDFVNDEGSITQQNSDRWATYLDNLYNSDDGYFFYDIELDGQKFENIVIPHVSALGNHETGQRHHIRWPACVNTGSSEPGYPKFVAANWMQQLFHFPYNSEGFYSEFRPDHPNMDPKHVREGYGKGGFGKLSFSDYLLLIVLDNSQNWSSQPDQGLRDWEGNLITDEWPWFETHHSDVRQDLWLKNLLEPDNGKTAPERYKHIIPMWHRGLFGTVRLNMSLKNREILSDWLPLLYRNGVWLIKEGHDHSYTRTIPMSITETQPEGTIIRKNSYQPNNWELSPSLSEEYLDEYFSINTIVNEDSNEIIGWEYQGNYITYNSEGMIATGHGGWAASRRNPGDRGGGNAGLWFVDSEKGGDAFGGEESYHITVVELSSEGLEVNSIRPGEMIDSSVDDKIIQFRRIAKSWEVFNTAENIWLPY